jgi:hypothetical protein
LGAVADAWPFWLWLGELLLARCFSGFRVSSHSSRLGGLGGQGSALLHTSGFELMLGE